jgi:hypothetical protein
MKISENEFNAYRQVQYSGITNMFNIKLVGELSKLNEKQILYIMENYGELENQYGEFEQSATMQRSMALAQSMG